MVVRCVTGMASSCMSSEIVQIILIRLVLSQPGNCSLFCTLSFSHQGERLLRQKVMCRYDRFSFDITDALQGHASNHQHEVLVQVFDPTGNTRHTICTD